MAAHWTLDEQAESFAEQFPSEDRAGIKEWYRERLEEESRKSGRRRLEAAVTVFLLVGLLPSLCLWAYFRLS